MLRKSYLLPAHYYFVVFPWINLVCLLSLETFVIFWIRIQICRQNTPFFCWKPAAWRNDAQRRYSTYLFIFYYLQYCKSDQWPTTPLDWLFAVIFRLLNCSMVRPTTFQMLCTFTSPFPRFKFFAYRYRCISSQYNFCDDLSYCTIVCYNALSSEDQILPERPKSK